MEYNINIVELTEKLLALWRSENRKIEQALCPTAYCCSPTFEEGARKLKELCYQGEIERFLEQYPDGVYRGWNDVTNELISQFDLRHHDPWTALQYYHLRKVLGEYLTYLMEKHRMELEGEDSKDLVEPTPIQYPSDKLYRKTLEQTLSARLEQNFKGEDLTLANILIQILTYGRGPQHQPCRTPIPSHLIRDRYRVKVEREFEENKLIKDIRNKPDFNPKMCDVLIDTLVDEMIKRKY